MSVVSGIGIIVILKVGEGHFGKNGIVDVNTWNDEVVKLAKKLGFQELDTRNHQLLLDFWNSYKDRLNEENLFKEFLSFEENYYSPDLLFDQSIDFEKLTVSHVMDTDILSLPLDYPVIKLARAMNRRLLSGAPVLDEHLVCPRRPGPVEMKLSHDLKS